MKLEEAMKIMSNEIGFVVSFDKKEPEGLVNDYFPDVKNGERFIPTIEIAQEYAEKFANSTSGKYYVNIRVLNHNFNPVNIFRMIREY